jgi:hypothetical protein
MPAGSRRFQGSKDEKKERRAHSEDLPFLCCPKVPFFLPMQTLPFIIADVRKKDARTPEKYEFF